MNMQAKRPILPTSVTRPRSLARARFHVEPQDNVRVPFGGQLHVESAA